MGDRPLRAAAPGRGCPRGRVELLASTFPEVPAERLWIANTDADTEVPAHWLSEQVRTASTGAELVIGTVQPDPAELDPDQLAGWWARHTLPEGHGHVFGANLAFTLAAYRLAGGFPPWRTHEDIHLVQRMQELGVPWEATPRAQVVASARRWGRAPGGFAGYLREIDHSVPQERRGERHVAP